MTEAQHADTDAAESASDADHDTVTEHVTNGGLTITESDGKTVATEPNGTVREVDGSFLTTVKAVAHLLGL